MVFLIRSATLSNVHVTLGDLVGKSLQKELQVEVGITDSTSVDAEVEDVEKSFSRLNILVA